MSERTAVGRAPHHRRIVATGLLATIGLSSSPAHADADLDALKAQIERLSAIVAEQEARLATLEGRSIARDGVQDSPLPLEPLQTSERVATEPAPAGSVRHQEIGRFPDNAIVRAGDFEGSIVIPGTSASVRIGGYVQADMGYDFDSLGFSDALNLRTLPLDGSSADGDQVFRSHARYSRLNIDIRDETQLGAFRTFLEFDFFGSGNTFTNNYSPVLRHAAAGIGSLYFGQFWSQFTDLAAFPEGVSSPLGQPLIRNPGIRWRTDLTENWRVAVGLEDPAGDLSGDSALLASDSVPNLTGYVQYESPWGRIRVAGLWLQLESVSDRADAGGVHISGRFNLPFLHEKDNLAFSVQAGEGFAHYYATLSNAGLEGVVADDGSIDVTGISAGYLAYQHWWSDTLRSTLKISGLEFDAPVGSDALALDNGWSYGANLFWTPLNNATFGLEYVYAERQVFDGQDGSGSRLSGIARFDF